MRTISLLVLSIFISVSVIADAGAQDVVVDDTLDWHGYFPLKIGNEWQYFGESWDGSIGTLEEWYETWHILDDSLINDQLYYLMETSCYTISINSQFPFFTPSCNSGIRDTLYLRYDEKQANVVVRRMTAPGLYVDELRFRYDFRLDAPFGSYQTALSGLSYGYHNYEEALQISGDLVDTTVKSVQVISAIPDGLSFAHGIGFLRQRFDEGGGTDFKLIYARTDRGEYGEAIRVSNKDISRVSKDIVAEVYPNPSSGSITIGFRLPEVEVITISIHDIIGREIVQRELGVNVPGEHRETLDLDLGSGMYLVRVWAEDSVIATRSLVIISDRK